MKKKYDCGGFTLIELLVTIFIVSVGLIGVMSFFNTTLQSQFEAKNEVIAAELAQESTELVRNIVDYNYLNNYSWYLNLSDNAGTSNCKAIDRNAIVDPSSSYYHKCITDNNMTDVCLNASNSTYQQCASSNTGFKRTLSIVLDNSGTANLDNGGCIKAIATVSWSGGDKKTTATDIICKPRQ